MLFDFAYKSFNTQKNECKLAYKKIYIFTYICINYYINFNK